MVKELSTSDTNSGGVGALRWYAVGGLYLAGIALLAVAASMWRATDAALLAESIQNDQLREFHSALVTSIHKLAEQSGVLTSSDMAPVRFRLREPGGELLGHRAFEGYLARLDDNSNDSRAVVPSVPNSMGTLDFGLCPPGRYRLTVMNSEGYELSYSFRTYPGVPTDRTMTCPGTLDIHLANARGHVDAGLPSTCQNLVAVATIAPDDAQYGDWSWKLPAHPQAAEVACVVGAVDTNQSRASLWPGLSSAVDVEPDRQTDRGLFDIPYRYFKVLHIRWLRRAPGAGEGEELCEVGAIRFSDSPALSREPLNEWELNRPAPRFEARPGWVIAMPIELPDEVVAYLHAQASPPLSSRRAASPPTATSTPAPPRRLPAHASLWASPARP
jgi:hypothetical protein